MESGLVGLVIRLEESVDHVPGLNTELLGRKRAGAEVKLLYVALVQQHAAEEFAGFIRAPNIEEAPFDQSFEIVAQDHMAMQRPLLVIHARYIRKAITFRNDQSHERAVIAGEHDSQALLGKCNQCVTHVVQRPQFGAFLSGDDRINNCAKQVRLGRVIAV